MIEIQKYFIFRVFLEILVISQLSSLIPSIRQRKISKHVEILNEVILFILTKIKMFIN